jgi:phage/plasmid-like protein (TIGR03299 family)
MSHLIETMAYTGQTPWHNLGNQLPAKQPIDVWAREAGMDWSIRETPVRYMATPSNNDTSHSSSVSDLYGEPMEFADQKVLYRSDTKAPLSVVSARYQVVQPRQVLEFYRDLTEVSGYELETAGVLKAGRKFWALARTGKSSVLKGSDVVNGYLLLATSCDGTLATTATPTTVRVVCNNTLSIALSGASGFLTAQASMRMPSRSSWALPSPTGTDSCTA